MDELRDVLARYYGIGEMLHLPNDKLEETRGQNLSAADAMRKVIMEWLKQNYNSSRFGPPTWKALVDAVEHPAGGNNKAEAEKIALRHKKGEYWCLIAYNKQVSLLKRLGMPRHLSATFNFLNLANFKCFTVNMTVVYKRR